MREMQVIAYDENLSERDQNILMNNEERIAYAYERYLNAPSGRRGNKRYPIAVAVGRKFRLYFRESLIVVMKTGVESPYTASEVGEVRL